MRVSPSPARTMTEQFSTMRLIAIVEGHGERFAVPPLLRRIGAALEPPVYPEVLRPIRVPKTKLLQDGQFEKALELAARKVGPEGRILVLLDADRDCPKELATSLAERAAASRPDRTTGVVIAKSEYEAWFLAAAESLAGMRGLADPLPAPDDAEAILDAKGWLRARMAPGYTYAETTDQSAFSATFDHELSRRRSASFDKLWREVSRLLAP